MIKKKILSNICTMYSVYSEVYTGHAKIMHILNSVFPVFFHSNYYD